MIGSHKFETMVRYTAQLVVHSPKL